MRDPERRRADATGSGETGCDDLRSEARNSSGDVAPFASDDGGKAAVLEADGGMREEAEGLVDVEALDVVG